MGYYRIMDIAQVEDQYEVSIEFADHSHDSVKVSKEQLNIAGIEQAIYEKLGRAW